jgi:hypothetical protein
MKMLGVLLMILLMVGGFVVFGSLGGMLGERLERGGGGENLSPALGVIFGVAGTALAMWIISILAGW